MLPLFSRASDKTGPGRGEETADSVTRRPQDGATGGAEGGNTNTQTRTQQVAMID